VKPVLSASPPCSFRGRVETRPPPPGLVRPWCGSRPRRCEPVSSLDLRLVLRNADVRGSGPWFPACVIFRFYHSIKKRISQSKKRRRSCFSLKLNNLRMITSCKDFFRGFHPCFQNCLKEKQPLQSWSYGLTIVFIDGPDVRSLSCKTQQGG
jgi:hypothetical protein